MRPGGKNNYVPNSLLISNVLLDLYVHAEIQGAASVIIRNRSDYVAAGQKIPPPRTLNEAGTLAICFSKAWEEKVVINAYWVHHDQVFIKSYLSILHKLESILYRYRKHLKQENSSVQEDSSSVASETFCQRHILHVFFCLHKHFLCRCKFIIKLDGVCCFA